MITANTRIEFSEIVLCKGNVVRAHTTKQYDDVESEIHLFSNSTLEGGE
jgi:hypothetical protein